MVNQKDMQMISLNQYVSDILCNDNNGHLMVLTLNEISIDPLLKNTLLNNANSSHIKLYIFL